MKYTKKIKQKNYMLDQIIILFAEIGSYREIQDLGSARL